MEISDYWGVIVRRKLVLMLSFVLVFGSVSAYLFTTDPVYESECKILLVDEVNQRGIGSFTIDDIMMRSMGQSDPIMTQIEILKTRPILEEVKRRCNIVDNFGNPVSLQHIRNMFDFQHIRGTNIISITKRHKDRYKAADVLNTLVEVFIEQNQDMNRKKITGVKNFLENQLALQKQKVNQAEQMVMEFKTQTKTISLDMETSVRVNALANLEAERIRLESELKGLQAQKYDIDQRLNMTGSQAAPHYSSLAAAREHILTSSTNVNARLREVITQINSQYRSMKDLPPLEIQLARLMREERIMNEIYTNLLVTYEEYKILEAAQVASIKLIEPARPEENPVWPRKKSGLALAGMAAIFFGIGLSFLFDYLHDRPNNIEEIKEILQTKSLGTVPQFDKNNPLFMKDNPTSLPADCLRLIYTNLKFTHAFNRKSSAIMITSASSSEGKTTIAANLAITLSNMGKNTALVDLDLRRPALNKLFECKNNALGISDYLAGNASFNQTFWTPPFQKGLTLYTSGKIHSNPTELICSPRLIDFFNKVTSAHDVIIFDSAPITTVAESLDITRCMDGIILVSDYLNNNRKDLKAVNEIMQDKNLPLLGVVINNTQHSLNAYYKYASVNK
ncbi:Tyrosine-protein kinase EpsD [Chitinispirillum alkaliphilum]|nr:Tyrosine-protein kinase EpsD [Chitinispirillum alkaliphilum]